MLALLFTITQWIIRAGALIYVPYRRSPEAAKGWLLLFMIAPWPALIVYVFVGRARHPKWRRERAEALPAVLERFVGKARNSFEQCRGELQGDSATIASLGVGLAELPPLTGNDILLESEYDRFVDRLVSDIDGARDHVHLMFYIFACDETGNRVMSALEAAARRGVTCRLLIDAFGSLKDGKEVGSRMKSNGVEFNLILPFRLWGRATRADMRNHRKIAVIDGSIGWIGSQNIVNAQGEASKPNRELMARVTGPTVAELQVVFIGDWYLETATELSTPNLFPAPAISNRGKTAQVVPSGPDYTDGRIDMMIVALTHAANKCVVLTTPYFVPSEPLLFALKTAAIRGIDVRLIISAVTDSIFVDLAQASYFAELMRAGARVSLCERHFLHAKHISVDDEIVLLGSTNMDMRSFELNSEISLLVFDEEVVRAIHALENEYLAGGRQLELERWTNRNFAKRVASNLARLVSPLL